MDNECVATATNLIPPPREGVSAKQTGVESLLPLQGAEGGTPSGVTDVGAISIVAPATPQLSIVNCPLSI